jgi:hypothetical protein
LLVGGYEEPDVFVDLFEVHAQAGDSFCAQCMPGNRLELVTDAQLTGDAYSLERKSLDGGSWWWMSGPSADLEFGLADLPRVRATAFFQIGNAPCGDERDVTIGYANTEQVVHLDGSQTSTVNLPVDLGQPAETVHIHVSGLPCSIESDPRKFQLQVYFPSSIEPP